MNGSAAITAAPIRPSRSTPISRSFAGSKMSVPIELAMSRVICAYSCGNAATSASRPTISITRRGPATSSSASVLGGSSSAILVTGASGV
ncbi:MAG: hypothetical protein IPN32_21000 [Deltaproteobacteria bacterium]|nr:hypothetical protein [Deltaproteobacteria bacterium]